MPKIPASAEISIPEYGLEEEKEVQLPDEEEPSLFDEKNLDGWATLSDGEKAQLPGELVSQTPAEIKPEEREALFQKVLKMAIHQKVYLAMFGNQDARGLLIHDANKIIPLAVLRNPKITEDEILTFAQLRNAPEEVLKMIAKHKTWPKNYFIKLALVANPKTPLSVAIKFLDHLRDRDLANLSRSKNISSVLARAAARVIIKRKG
jgi:hypothetical protein